ncbi:MAG: hypothetical protein CMF25_00525 [Kangiellaceae bacterium]|nr:hypothetical protein [Kangiellaceae bacterium]|tara:strand:+ start:33954 stop:38474 length:4521 start_codon:yes stop_codon:yes gene_type:complete
MVVNYRHKAIFGWCILSLLLFLSPIIEQTVFAQTVFAKTIFDAPIAWRQFSLQSGLSSYSVNQIHQDSSGIIWIASEEGLSRFNGSTFTHFRHNPKAAEGIPTNSIQGVTVDKHGIVWLASEAGLIRYTPSKGHFEVIQSKPVLLVTAIGDNLYYVLDNQLFQLPNTNIDPSNTKTALNNSSTAPKAQSLPFPDEQIVQLHTDHSKRLWVLTTSHLYQVNAGMNNLRIALPAQSGSESSMIYHSESSIWLVSDANKLFVLDQTTASPQQWKYIYRFPDSTQITALGEGKRNQLWLGSADGFIFSFDQSHSAPKTIANLSVIQSSPIRQIYRSKSDVVWVVHQGNGFYQWQPEYQAFGFIQQEFSDEQANDTVQANDIVQIHERTNGDMWWLTPTGIGHKKRDAAPRHSLFTPSSPKYVQLVESPYQELLALHENGLDLLILENNVSHVPYLEGLNNATRLAKRGAEIWVYSSSEGISHYQWRKGKLTLHSIHPKPTGLNVKELVVDNSGAIWLVTHHKVIRYQPDSETMIDYSEKAGLSGLVSTQHISFFREYPTGTYWIGTNSAGLYKFRLKSGQFEHITSFDGLPSDNLAALEVDGQGYLWLATSQGLARFNPQSGRSRHYSVLSNLPNRQFSRYASTRGLSGNLSFGTHHGIVHFPPYMLGKSQPAPDVAIHQVAISGKPYRQAISNWNGQHLDLQYEQRHVSIEFGGIYHQSSIAPIYQYRVIGLNDQWYDLGNKQTLTLPYLDSGNYQVEIRASLNGSTWSVSPASLQVSIGSYFWVNPWMRALYLLLIMGTCGFIVAQRRKFILAEKAARRSLQESEKRLKLALWGSGDQLWSWSIAESHRLKKLLGQPLETNYSSDADPFEEHLTQVHCDDKTNIEATLKSHIEGATDHVEATYRMRRDDGEWHWVLTRGKISERDSNGMPTRLSGTIKNIDKLKRIEQKLKLIAQAVENTSDGAWIADSQFNIVYTNHAFGKITGFNAQQVEGKKLRLLEDERNPDDMYAAIMTSLKSRGQWKGELWDKRKNGRTYPVRVNISTVKDDKGNITHYVGLFADITQQKHSEEELRQLANYDVLTNLPNRMFFHERLHHALNHAARSKSQVALLFLDLDHFKAINDTLGHACGDMLLREVAKRLKRGLRKEDTVARLGGDEFVVIVENVSHIDKVTAVANKILESMQPTVILEGNEVHISPSIGIGLFPDDADNVEMLVQAADTAMYHAKKQGRNNFQFFTSEMNQQVQERLFMETHLRTAVKKQELSLVYQPKVSFKTGEVVGVEALLRWNHPKLGPISPMKFIPIAEETGIINDIGEWVLDEAVAQAQRWREQGILLPVAINLSAKQFSHLQLVERIEALLKNNHLPADLLQIEITESSLMIDMDAAIDTLNELRHHGIKIAVDDFGTGYSSLSYIRKLPVDYLKLDRSFIFDMAENSQAAALIENIIQLAHVLKLEVIAEGVETQAQYKLLSHMHCEQYQGYLFSRPIQADEISLMVKSASPKAQANR